MRSRVVSLALLYIKSTFSISLPSREELKKPKTLAKTLGIGLGILLLAADFGFIFVMMNLTMYDGLKSAGLQELMLLNAATTASVLVFCPRLYVGPLHVLHVEHRVGLSRPAFLLERVARGEDGSRLFYRGFSRHLHPRHCHGHLWNQGKAVLHVLRKRTHHQLCPSPSAHCYFLSHSPAAYERLEILSQ